MTSVAGDADGMETGSAGEGATGRGDVGTLVTAADAAGFGEGGEPAGAGATAGGAGVVFSGSGTEGTIGGGARASGRSEEGR